MTGLIIIGASGHGKVVADTAEACGYSDIAFQDQNWPEQTTNAHWPVTGVPGKSQTTMFCAVGNNEARARLFEELALQDTPILIHPGAVVSRYAQLGAGTLVVAGCVVNAYAAIGVGVILNTACSVDHDCTVGDFAHISPGARLAGNVSVGARSWIGIGAVVREGVSIGTDVVVGAGAVVLNDIEDGARVGGVPARRI
ncbi:acetyltransferase [Yoonia sp. F2084L]|uniref:acetyltransferase n=1 Tax=Yoonia sp. F2084L TaxID=2926419 RepID=UPI001FF0EF94|nr:acetyltransferase [Yoonia sp. F2084L]MCK0097144.1 acetyltransferase [Yoonia sp. F2084L]